MTTPILSAAESYPVSAAFTDVHIVHKFAQ